MKISRFQSPRIWNKNFKTSKFQKLNVKLFLLKFEPRVSKWKPHISKMVGPLGTNQLKSNSESWLFAGDIATLDQSWGGPLIDINNSRLSK